MKTKENPIPQPGTRIDLEEIASKYLGTLQRVFDITMCSLAGARKINEADYEAFSNSLQVMPRQQARMDFETAKRQTEQWLLRNGLSDSLAMVMPVLEDARTICALCDFKAAKRTDQGELQKIVTDQRAEFLGLPLPEKFARVEQRYGVTCDVREHILSLMEVTKALMTKEGILTKEETADGQKLSLRIRSVKIVAGQENVPGGVNLVRQVGDSQRDLFVGESIHFTKAEHIGALLTVGIFITDILRGVQAYARKTGVSEN